jgi:iron complex outermembrane receptor protein
MLTSIGSSSAYPAENQIVMELTRMSLAELMNIEITSVSKKPESLSDAAAAVFVITQEDIRRSGVTNLPDALRMVPGLQVGRQDSNKWGVTSRGFIDRFSNKLLVLIDGRTVYTPLFSGVYWDMQDVMLEDIERIEVIRGPGAALWGANAVNGVINILTKSAKDTQGGLLSTGFGNEDKENMSVRFGGKLGEDTSYRIYGKYFNRDNFVELEGNPGKDDWDAVRSGFRLDSDISESDSLTVQGELYEGAVGSTYIIPYLLSPYSLTIDAEEDFIGANLLTRWSRTYSDSSDVTLQLYYDWFDREFVVFDEERNTFDLDFQHHLRLSDRHDLVWGLGYRFSGDQIGNSYTATFDPTSRNDQLFSAFLTDDITLIDDTLVLTLGSKFEHNDYTGFEIQPNVRLMWTPHERHKIWASVSRAVRTPSRYEHDAQIDMVVLPPGSEDNPLPLPVRMASYGRDSFDSEDLVAYELGYRTLAADWLTLDTALYYNVYDHLLTAEPSENWLYIPEPAPGYFHIPLLGDNKMTGESYGAEVAATCRIREWWNLHMAYTFSRLELHPVHGSRTVVFELYETRNPRHQCSIRSLMNVTKNLELDLWGRYVDAFPKHSFPSYFALDARLGWKPNKNLEFSIGVQNALDNRHLEFEYSLIQTAMMEVERSVYAKITLHF